MTEPSNPFTLSTDAELQQIIDAAIIARLRGFESFHDKVCDALWAFDDGKDKALFAALCPVYRESLVIRNSSNNRIKAARAEMTRRAQAKPGVAP